MSCGTAMLLQCNAEDATNGWSTNNVINKKFAKIVTAVYKAFQFASLN